MRPFSSLSRKPLLLLGFVSVFIFLYHVASHPKVTQTMQPTSYYDNYDEAVCLPELHMTRQPPKKKAKAAFVILVRNSEQEGIASSIMNLEDKFNKNFHYPYVFLNEEPFTEEFKMAMTRASPNAVMKFGLIDKQQHWGYPSFVNETYAAECREKMLMDGKQYGFVVTLKEMPNTIPTLWDTVMEYAKSRRIDISEKSRLLFPYFKDENNSGYNYCHFWSNFEIASLNLWRSPAYRDFFHYLDQTGKFFYERWGDAPVHSLGAGLLLETDQIHYFEDIGYQHDLYRHCPTKKTGCRCNCPIGTTKESIDHDNYYDTCLPQWQKWVKTSEARKAHWNMWSS
ncbi:nucleotide-diphospho-sugar transferase [Halteromyces radiatus]|uniref:nucleotide-diphospho-sugar transferase n=1 Tax=Halteromyces radiatus TaxID=101107 RepID=UPI00221F9EFC|nr:nucleotide-diphospho-sugar transferase [Halteromyces radiatus]KAI8099478.1 nucleotide-diphospho-sugar transferase [Halteromyces radiatus]